MNRRRFLYDLSMFSGGLALAGSGLMRRVAAFEQDGDPDFAEDVPDRVGEGSPAEDEDALIDVLDLGHDLDDPQNPDGYGVPPAPDGGSAAFDLAELRDPVDDKGDYGRDVIDPAL